MPPAPFLFFLFSPINAQNAQAHTAHTLCPVVVSASNTMPISNVRQRLHWSAPLQNLLGPNGKPSDLQPTLEIAQESLEGKKEQLFEHAPFDQVSLKNVYGMCRNALALQLGVVHGAPSDWVLAETRQSGATVELFFYHAPSKAQVLSGSASAGFAASALRASVATLQDYDFCVYIANCNDGTTTEDLAFFITDDDCEHRRTHMACIALNSHNRTIRALPYAYNDDDPAKPVARSPWPITRGLAGGNTYMHSVPAETTVDNALSPSALEEASVAVRILKASAAEDLKTSARIVRTAHSIGGRQPQCPLTMVLYAFWALVLAFFVFSALIKGNENTQEL